MKPRIPSHLQFLTVKFLGTRKEDAERMGVLCVQVYGYHYAKTGQRSVDFLKQLVSGSEEAMPVATPPRRNVGGLGKSWEVSSSSGWRHPACRVCISGKRRYP